jgi:hypothetical protein
MLKRGHVEFAWEVALFCIATKTMVRGSGNWRALGALKMPPMTLEIGSHGALAPSMLALPEGTRA